MSRPSHATLLAVGAALCSLAIPSPRAATVDATSTTYTSVGQEARGDGTVRTTAPVYQFVTLRADQLRAPWGDPMAVVVSGWGSADVVGSRDRLGPGADLSLAYLEGGAFDRRLSFRVGRQFVTGGAARMSQVDGANLRVAIAGGFGVDVFGGAVVVPRFAAPLATGLAGGRLHFQPSFDTEVGLSYAQVEGHEATLRREVGLDGRARLTPAVVLSGSAFYDPLVARLAEATGDVSWRIVRGLTVAMRYQRTAPDLFLPANSIWTVFAPAEARDAVGGSASWSPGRHLALRADYLRIVGSDATGFRTSGRATWSRTYYTLGAELRALRYAELGHLTPRLFAIFRVAAGLTFTADLEESWLAHPMNGETRAWTATSSAAWAFVDDWRVAAALVGGQSPFLSQQLSLLARLEWTPTFVGGESR